eukprot:m.190811 g.190811  ORF g.190811 m.190811 type:complete len:50 (-) comp14830_c0_seq1:2688-2837(-)
MLKSQTPDAMKVVQSTARPLPHKKGTFPKPRNNYKAKTTNLDPTVLLRQ